jgi:hypothetical protein
VEEKHVEAFKLAFDTIIVGALALPWLAIVVRIFFPGFATRKTEETIRLLAVAPEHTRDAVASVLLIAVGYFAGSAVTRVADDCFDDREIRYLPMEHTIRNHVYCEEKKADAMKEPGWPLGTNPMLRDRLKCPPAEKGEKEIDYTSEIFHLQEAKLLQSGPDKVERLQQLHEQIVVLRGTALNAIVFAVLCLFGVFAEYRNRQPQAAKLKKYLSYVPPLFLLALGGWWFGDHIRGTSASYSIHSHPPTMEIVVILLGAAGFFVVASDDDRNVYRSGFFLALIFAVLAYLGWWGTEVLYNQYVIHAIYSIT